MNSENLDDWTQHLIPKLSGPLKDTGPWHRVEESRSGGWNCLHGDAGENAIHWFHLSEKGKLKPLDPFSDKRLPVLPNVISQWVGQGNSVELLAWRLGSRAIFRLGSGHFAKVFRKDRHTLMRWEFLKSNSTGNRIQIPEVTDWDSKNKVLTVKAAPGDSLNAIWKSGVWKNQHLQTIIQILDMLGTTKNAADLPEHSIADEIEILEKRLQVFQRVLKDPSPKVPDLVKEVILRLQNLPTSPSVVCHRDFHDKQVLVSNDQITLLDLDLLAKSDPALDAGNILAHLRLRSLQGLPVPWENCVASISQWMQSREIQEERLRAWTASTFARLLLIYSRRKRPKELLHTLESDLEELLTDTGKWQGVFS